MKTLTLALALSTLFSFQAKANILFCDFYDSEKGYGHLGVRELQHKDPKQVMQESWVTDDIKKTDLALDKIKTHEVSDSSIEVSYTAHSVEANAPYTISFNLTYTTFSHQVCAGSYGRPIPCFTHTTPGYIGTIKIVSKKNKYSYSGEAKCQWQYRDL